MTIFPDEGSLLRIQKSTKTCPKHIFIGFVYPKAGFGHPKLSKNFVSGMFYASILYYYTTIRYTTTFADEEVILYHDEGSFRGLNGQK